MIGGALRRRLESQGHRVHTLVRGDGHSLPDKDAAFAYSAQSGEIRLDPGIKLDAVVNLAGANIAARRWSPAYKRLIVDSRVRLTQVLALALAAVEHRPAVLLSASAIGFYGDAGGETADESSPRGADFLADVAGDWEAACQPARDAGIRTVKMRFGVVLGREGGMLKNMLPAFRWGVGGKLGGGEQPMSWIALGDALSLIEICLRDESIDGPVNFVSGRPVTNADFTLALGNALRRPTVSPVLQAWLIRLLFGEMGETLMLRGKRVVSRRHGEIGFTPAYADIGQALAHELGQTPEQ